MQGLRARGLELRHGLSWLCWPMVEIPPGFECRGENISGVVQGGGEEMRAGSGDGIFEGNAGAWI
jgi:hypothetical protein